MMGAKHPEGAGSSIMLQFGDVSRIFHGLERMIRFKEHSGGLLSAPISPAPSHFWKPISILQTHLFDETDAGPRSRIKDEAADEERFQNSRQT